MKQYLFISLCLLLLSCSFFSKQLENNIKKDVDSQEGTTSRNEHEAGLSIENKMLREKKVNSCIPIDTVSLCVFWNGFQQDLRFGNKQKVIEVFNFPIHAIFPVLFRYAHDCDTIAYIENEEKYRDFDIDENQMTEYYDFVFTEVLKEIIYQTSVDDLLTKGYRSEKIPGITYTFFPKNYNVKVNCPNDHNLKFHISYKEDRWNIAIGGL